MGHYCPSPYPEDVGPPGGAGLTSKPHRDRSTRSRLTWAVSPAAGIGLPAQPSRWLGSLRGATTGPGGCHDTTLARTGENVRRGRPAVFAETTVKLGHRPQLTAFQPCIIAELAPRRGLKGVVPPRASTVTRIRTGRIAQCCPRSPARGRRAPP